MTDFAVETDGGRIAGWRASACPRSSCTAAWGSPTSRRSSRRSSPTGSRRSATSSAASRRAPSRASHTVEQNGGRARRARRLRIDKAWVIGHSWGGHLGDAHRGRGQRLLGLVAIDPLGAVPDGGEADLDLNLTAQLSPRRTLVRIELDDAARRRGDAGGLGGDVPARLAVLLRHPGERAADAGDHTE